jgi:hypothetical protein
MKWSTIGNVIINYDEVIILDDVSFEEVTPSQEKKGKNDLYEDE